MLYEDSGDPAQPDTLLDAFQTLPQTIQDRIGSWGDVQRSGELIRQSSSLAQQLEAVMSETKRYEIREDSGASEIIEAESLEAALEAACEWASKGSYDERVSVKVYVHEIDEDGEAIPGEYASGEVDAGPEPKPEETECGTGDEDHDWQSPLEVVGGCTENPGVWSTGGTSFRYKYVCAKCGMYKTVRTAGPQRTLANWMRRSNTVRLMSSRWHGWRSGRVRKAVNDSLSDSHGSDAGYNRD